MDGLVQLKRPERRAPKPEWLKVPLPSGAGYTRVRDLLSGLRLNTVCQESRCPNVAECWGGGTATVMLMGDVCSRGCRFCHVASGELQPLDPDEPEHLAQAVAELGLKYLVITSVDRDELPDQGSAHFAQAIRALKARSPATRVEVLIPDFRGERDCLSRIVDAGPDVVAHNLETVRRLTPSVRDHRASYAQSLGVLEALKELRPGLPTKSSLMLGLGETPAELSLAFADLRGVGVDVLTLGQYLRPSSWHLEVQRYVSPEEFAALRGEALALGYAYVAAGPLVRSSYRAAEFFMESMLGSRSTGSEPRGT